MHRGDNEMTNSNLLSIAREGKCTHLPSWTDDRALSGWVLGGNMRSLT